MLNTTRKRAANKIDRRSRWVKLTPNRTLPVQERPAFYALELVTGLKNEHSGFWQDFGHAWIRLITPAGEVYSIGFFPDESMGVTPELRPGLRFPGMLLHPDKYDTAGFLEQVTRIPVSKTHFYRLIHDLETMQAQRADGSLAFSLVDRSCVWFVVMLAAKAGVQVKAEYSLIQAAFDALAKRFAAFNLAENRSNRIRQIAFNSGLYILGGGHTYRQQWIANADGERTLLNIKSIKPIFTRSTAIFNQYIPFYHVRALRNWQQHYEHLNTASPQHNSNPRPPDRTKPYGTDSSGKRDQTTMVNY